MTMEPVFMESCYISADISGDNVAPYYRLAVLNGDFNPCIRAAYELDPWSVRVDEGSSGGIRLLPTRVQRAPSEESGDYGCGCASRPSDYAPFPVSPLGAAMLAFLGLAAAIRGWRKGPDWLFLAGTLMLILGGAGLGVIAALALMV